MDSRLRDLFDRELEAVLAHLPDQVHRLLDEVPLVVEDYPSKSILARTGIRSRGQLCGLYTGIPLDRRHVEQSGVLSDVIHLFREGVLNLASQPDGTIRQSDLRREIRTTILHELGHHHGLSESELQALGY
jgi:predicted Zn-dependent protease with MMP-like domain